MIEVVGLSLAFVMGLLVKRIGLPPLVGFLLAGFGLNALGPYVGLPSYTGPVLEHIAHLGVLLLLFTVGLKLKVKNLIEPVVVGGALLHFVITVSVFGAGLMLFTSLALDTVILLAIALSFSSTVLAAKVLEAKRELGAFHGRVAIGILIIQDLIALLVLSIAGGNSPSWWALIVFALPLLRPALYWLLDMAGHDELMVLMGMVLAVAVGGMGFESLGLSSELGALAMGVMLSGHSRSTELSHSLWGLKEVFLIGFFLQIGMNGLPDTQALIFAVVFALVLPLKGILFFGLLILFRLRARNAFLGALSLTCYSEFGLIVASGVLEEWLVPLAITVALSFIIAAPLNRLAHPIFEWLELKLVRLERKSMHPDEQPASLGDATVIVLGMGRTGTAAYRAMVERGYHVVGLDSDPDKVARQQALGRNVVYADAEDTCFWHGVDLSAIDAFILAMPDTEGVVVAAKQIRKLNFTGPVVTHALYEDAAALMQAAGADETFLTMSSAGMGLAERTSARLATPG
ncbi:cation:proton antiporter family protein [Saccharospirillum impatiens]|uniref:cation:proton antiporter family protein n=1 Tax=Saccharospirillum impatiens TaxID=169438 RepID=UPI00040952C4|nr:cation:proton antiporter family protein [Saccharospirillum impatiens]